MLLLVALLVAGARPASADTGLGMRAWRWLVSVWATAGPEIDPNGNHAQLPPPAPPITSTTTGGATSGRGASPSGPGEGHTARTQAPSPR